ncbi:HSP70/90 co-chaperone [Coemansia sp. RSA 552]|nr:HSP70/90 co-chaperone [Coemansia sp. RSA 552]
MSSDQAEQRVPAGPQRPTESDGERLARLDKELNKIPLFMTELPAEDDEENVAVEAVRSLVADEPPEEMAATLKSEGNLCFKRGRYTEAAKYYTSALEYDHDNRALEVSLLTNRAAVNLELHNYGRVLNDCSRALQLQPKTPKALYRAAKACIALAKFDEAIECVKWALGIDPGSAELLQLRTEIEEAQRTHAQRVREQEERKQKNQADRELLQRAMEIRSQLTFDTAEPLLPGEYAWENHHNQAELDQATGHVLWPVVFLYPETKESDFVQQFDETTTLRDMLAQVLADPPPWDTARKYTIDNVDTYFLARPVGGTERDERLVKVAIGMRLGAVLDSPKYVIQDGIPNFLVLPRGDKFTEGFVEHYRQRRLAQEASVKKA